MRTRKEQASDLGGTYFIGIPSRAIKFFDVLLTETLGDALLIERWHQLIAEPLFSARADVEK